MCQIVEPARGAVRFHDDEVDFVLLEDRYEVVSIGGSVQELMLSSFCVENTAHCVAQFLLI